MGEFDAIIDYINQTGLVLRAVDLPQPEKMPLYIMWSESYRVIDANNKTFKTMKQLESEASGILREFRGSLLRYFQQYQSGLFCYGDVTVVSTIEEINTMPCNSVESLIDVLKATALTMLLVLTSNTNLEEKLTTFLKGVLYVCAFGLNRLLFLRSGQELVRGVKVLFYENKRGF